jgi:Zn-dependent M16 (insulinase) family peptidase
MTSLRTYITIALQDLCTWLRGKLRLWLLADIHERVEGNRHWSFLEHKAIRERLEGLEQHAHAQTMRMNAIQQAETEAIARIEALEKQLTVNLGGIATGFARVHERLDALEGENALRYRAMVQEKAEGKTAKVAKPTPKRKPRKAGKPQ